MQGLSEAQGKGWAFDFFGIIIKYIVDQGFSLLRSDLRSPMLVWSLSLSICTVTFHFFFSIKNLSRPVSSATGPFFHTKGGGVWDRPPTTIPPQS